MRIRKDDMIDDVDAEHLPGGDEPSREFQIVFARSRIAGRVIVEQHDGRRAADRGFPNSAACG